MKLRPLQDKQKTQDKSKTKAKSRSKRILQSLVLGLISCAIAIFLSYTFWQPGDEELNLSAGGRKWFDKKTLLTDVYALFDLGVVDLNQDNLLDIFTVNHSDRQFVLLGEGDGQFSDNVLSQLSLDQQPEFPGLEPHDAPIPQDSGLYIYWQGRQIVILNHNTEDFKLFRGEMRLSADVTIFEEDAFAVEMESKQLNERSRGTQLKFAPADSNGRLIINPFNQSIQITFELNDEIPLERIFIGDRQINPTAHQFTFQLRDRHGLAWTNLDGLGFLDGFISRGGLRGRMPDLPETYRDELLVSDRDGVYQDLAFESNLTKDGCAGHQAAWTDYNRDGKLDIYNVCAVPPEGSRPGYPNQLFSQTSDGKFVDIAAEANLDIPVGGHFVWLDADRDGDLDLLWSEAGKFQLYLNQSGKFAVQTIEANAGDRSFELGTSKKLTVADYDNDGDFDVFSASPQGNVLLKNAGEGYQIVNPQTIGLPVRGLNANWVDYDNDGITDLHIVPSGLYHQNPAGEFTATNLLKSDRADFMQHSLANWFDVDNNGTRDLLIQTEYKRSFYQEIRDKFLNRFFPQKVKSYSSTIDLYTNLETNNNWLELELSGLGGNLSAIGAQVEVVTPSRTQLQEVGQSEGSHYSQGHYRLYFGLGQEAVEAINILWSDGNTQTIENVASNQLLTISEQ